MGRYGVGGARRRGAVVQGASAYLILTKYNNYAGIGSGDGVNKVAVLDPSAAMQDEYSATPVTVMKEVITVTGVTPDPASGLPNAVSEWCINTAAIDPYTKSAIVNSEDGVVYRWDFTSNTLLQRLRLTSGRRRGLYAHGDRAGWHGVRDQ